MVYFAGINEVIFVLLCFDSRSIEKVDRKGTELYGILEC